MAKTDRNSGQRWSDKDISRLKQLAEGNMPTRVMGVKLGRTPNAIYTEASKLGVSLKPVNQSPYNRKPKK